MFEKIVSILEMQQVFIREKVANNWSPEENKQIAVLEMKIAELRELVEEKQHE